MPIRVSSWCHVHHYSWLSFTLSTHDPEEQAPLLNSTSPAELNIPLSGITSSASCAPSAHLQCCTFCESFCKESVFDGSSALCAHYLLRRNQFLLRITAIESGSLPVEMDTKQAFGTIGSSRVPSRRSSVKRWDGVSRTCSDWDGLRRVCSSNACIPVELSRMSN